MLKSDMYCFVYSFGIFIAFFLSSVNARFTVFISHDGEKTYLPRSSEAEVCMTPACVIAAADILTSLDETVDPCDDFYNFACGGWLKKQEVTEEEPLVNIFVIAQRDLNKKLRELLESKYKSSDPPFVKTMKDLYNTCVDVDTIEKQGSEPLKKLLRILGGGWPVVEGSDWDESSFDWVDSLILFRKLGLDYQIMLDLHVKYDLRNDTNNIIYLQDSTMYFSEANLSLGLEDPEIASYYRMMIKAAKLLGADESRAEKEMLEALNFEMDLIEIMKVDKNKSEERQNKTVNTIAELQDELPQVPWLKIINGLLLVEQVDENEPFINGKPSFLPKFADLITSTDKRVIANYMMWQAVLDTKRHLSKEWQEIEEDEEDDESSKKKEKEEPRWEKCLSMVEMNFEIGLSSYYIRTYFSDENKDEAMMLMKYIHKEFLKLLENNDWMDEKTRKKAEEKASAIKAYIGYPKELLNNTFVMKSFEGLTLNGDSYLENMLALDKWYKDEQLSTLRKTFDESDLIDNMKYSGLMDVNAYYSTWDNSMSIPAGILHDAFYNKDKPEYMNFAEIGYIIGHEITHGFDNQGRHYDKDGKKVAWWDKESDEHFLKKAKCIIDQYDNYTTFVGEKVNGEKTQNENIADNGGLKEAYLAYQSWIEDHGTEPLLPGVDYSQNQIFWLSAARAWCSKYQPENLKELLIIDVHSPAKFRIIGPMSNLEEFSKDFKCSADAPMNRKYKCEVW